MRRPYDANRYSQGQPGRLPYPDDQQALPAPGFAPPPGQAPAYGHQLGQQGAAPPNDPNAIRPPGAIGGPPAQAAVPGAQQPPAGTAALPPEEQPELGTPKELPPNLRRQLVTLSTKEPAGTIIVDTANTYLYLVLGGGKAIRYGVRVGREGFTWTGTERISKMKEWPDWFPPPEMIERQPYLPRVMAGGPGQSARRARHVSRPHALPHPRHQPAVDHRPLRVVGLRRHAQRGRRGFVQPRAGRHPRGRVAGQGAGNGCRRRTPPPPANPMAPPQHNGTAISASPLPAAR